MKPTKAPSTPRLVTKAEYARVRDMDRSLLTRRIKAGVVQVEGEKELIDVEKADAALAAALGPQRKRGSTVARPGSGRRSTEPRDGGMSLHQARTLRAREELERSRIARERESIELEVLKQKYVSVEDVATVWGEAFSLFKTQVLGIAPHTCHQLAATADHRACFQIVNGAVISALQQLVDHATDRAAAADIAGVVALDKAADEETSK